VSDKTIRETRILAEDEIIDISVTQVPISSEIPHGVRYSFNYRIRMNEGWKTLSLIEINRRKIDEIKRR
jgi:hypothetical protein